MIQRYRPGPKYVWLIPLAKMAVQTVMIVLGLLLISHYLR